MIKRSRWLTICMLVALLVSIFSVNALAINPIANGKSSMTELRVIAKNALEDFAETEDWTNISITKETPLYNLAGSQYAYCFDLKNNDTEQTAYIILSTDSSSFPVIQFAPNAVSVYYDLGKKEQAVYVGPGQYYSASDTQYISLTNNDVIDKSDILPILESSQSESASDFSEIRASYLLERSMTTRSVVNLDVPCYQWYKGCVPTSAAMVLHYHYPNLNADHNDTISQLATAMGTINGSTAYNLIRNGFLTVLNNKNKTWTECGFDTTDALGIPKYGSAYNTATEYLAELDAGYPILIAMTNANGTSPAYPDGFGDHAIVGVGYSFVSPYNYIIVHTTAQSDGDVYLPLNSDTLGNYAWFYFHP